MAIKKAYAALVEFLEANKGKKVSDVMEKVLEICSAKSGGGGGASNCLVDANGKVTNIFCYYHKMWEPVHADGHADKDHVEYGKKANSSTGLNNMCKEGVSAWTSQQRISKKANSELLNDVATGKVKPNEILKKQEDIKASCAKVTPRKDKIGTKDSPVKKAA